MLSKNLIARTPEQMSRCEASGSDACSPDLSVCVEVRDRKNSVLLDKEDDVREEKRARRNGNK